MSDSRGALVPSVADELRAVYDTGRTRRLEWRRAQLDGLRRLLTDHEDELVAALIADVGKPALEAWATEVSLLRRELDHARRRLRRWAAPRRVGVPLHFAPARAAVHPSPLGVVLVLAPWNYPLQLALAPVVGALAAGNCVAVKPSERAPNTAAALARLLPRAVDADAVRILPGTAATAQALLGQRWDHIVFTGSAATARAVLEAAAAHLTPVTLELGGKSPAIVTESADLDVAARRIAWGKFLNAGQSCLAPDYAVVTADRTDEFLARLEAAVRRFYGADPRTSPDYGRLLDAEHVDRLVGAMRCGTVVFGGDADRAARYVAPTAIRDVDPDAPLMTDEIFGPILPVVTVASTEEAIAFVRAREHPLALYLFSRDGREIDRVLAATQSGGVAVNTTLIQAAIPGLPFGGVGASGIGAYHGRTGFERFSHLRAVVRRPTRPDLDLAYPPYGERTQRWWRRLL